MSVNGSANGHASPHRGLKAGIYAPIPTFFLPDTEELGLSTARTGCNYIIVPRIANSIIYFVLFLYSGTVADIPSFEAHVVRIAKAGVGPLLSGSMGEAHHLSHAERTTLIRNARSALDAAGLTSSPIIAGIGAGATREVVELAQEAAAAGADATIAILSGYYAGALDRKALKAFWTEVAQKSPLPVIIYNFPGAAGGIDLDSELITELASECPNIAGVKLTCGNVGKLTRISATVSEASFAEAHPRRDAAFPFLVLGGFADFLLVSAFANAHGAITGLANVAPYTLARLYDLSVAALSDPSTLPEAQRLQGIVARADWTIAKAGIAGTKYLLQLVYGYGGAPRRPLLPTDP
ncbi:hypothetical protein EW145_g8524, partial [Phellinidium pouzarii]